MITDKIESIKRQFKTYFESTGCSGVVIGLSGGLDSALVAKLCIDTLGKDKVKLIFIPDRELPQSEMNHIRLLQDYFGIPVETISIQSIVEMYQKLGYYDKLDKCADINISPRVRMTILYMVANQENRLVIGTCNKSELLCGYFSKFGDGASDYELIGDLFKTEVFEASRELGIPDEIIDKPPSAGLYEGQTDEKHFGMSYELLDEILYGLSWQFPFFVAERLDIPLSEVERIEGLVDVSKHKREMPPIPRG